MTYYFRKVAYVLGTIICLSVALSVFTLTRKLVNTYHDFLCGSDKTKEMKEEFLEKIRIILWMDE